MTIGGQCERQDLFCIILGLEGAGRFPNLCSDGLARIHNLVVNADTTLTATFTQR